MTHEETMRDLERNQMIRTLRQIAKMAEYDAMPDAFEARLSLARIKGTANGMLASLEIQGAS